MSVLKVWIIKICVTSIIIIICDIMVPKRFKNICNMIFGILMIIVVISPILQIINNKDMLVSKIKENNNFLNSSSIYINKQLLDNQNNSILDIYNQQICQQIKTGIESKLNISVSNIKAYMDMDQYNNIIVKRINIILDDSHNLGNNKNQEKMFYKIREFVSLLINIDKSNIYIE